MSVLVWSREGLVFRNKTSVSLGLERDKEFDWQTMRNRDCWALWERQMKIKCQCSCGGKASLSEVHAGRIS